MSDQRMSFEKELEYRSSKNQSVKKSILITGTIVAMIGGIIFYKVDQDSSEKANTAYAVAKDLIAQGDSESALNKLDEAIKQKQKSSFYYLKYQILDGQGNTNEAAINLDKAVEHDPKNTDYLYQSAMFYCNKGGNPEKGLERLKQLIQLEPKNSDYRLIYGSTLAQLGRFNDSIQVLETLVHDDPNYENAWNDLASIYTYAGYPDKSLKMRLHAVTRYPKSAFHWFWLGNIYDTQGNKSKAIEAYQKSIAFEPDSGAIAASRIALLSGKKMAEHYREIIEDSVPVLFKNSHAFVQAEIAGHTGLFLLDTGATDSVLFHRFFDKHHLAIGDDSPTTKYETAGGMISAPVFYSDIKMARFNIQNARVAVINDPSQNEDSDGIIGMNVLKNFNVKLDNLKGRVILSRK
jgi:tetratricopeptide (TPR) repeat protein